MIAAEINESEYRIDGSWTAFIDAGEFGPLPCGCCIVATEFDPVGPRLVFLMQRRDTERHTHELTEFARRGARVKVVW